MYKRLFSMFLVFVMMVVILCPGSTVNAEELKVSENSVDHGSSTRFIEEELAKNNTSVLNEIAKLKKEYEDMKVNSSPEDIKKLNDLIDTLTLEEKNYKKSKNAEIQPNVLNERKLTSKGDPNMMIPLVIGFFQAKGYKLSAELLIHARSNKKYMSTYDPVNGNRVKCSPMYAYCFKNNNAVGSGEFRNEGNTEQRDLYYAIHCFDYNRNGNNITIFDIYNYAESDRVAYGDLAGYAINDMYRAQQQGIITPYTVRIRTKRG